MHSDKFNKIRRLQAKQRELEEKLERGCPFNEEVFIIQEIDRIDKEITRLEEDRII